MKLTRHNGRSGKNGTYNPKHNDRRFDIENSEHIDQERSKQNLYWDCYQGFRTASDQEETDQIIYSFEQIEKAFYSERYDDFCEGQHERNKKTGHSSRDRTISDLWADKRTCPEETVIQIGTKELSAPPEILIQVSVEFFAEFERRFGEHIHILDWALHMDEATPHIQERHVFDCKNQYGEIAPQQEKALEALGFERPNPNQPKSRLNSRKITFDAACRAILFDICERHGLHLDREPEYGGRAYLEKQDYILMKQKEKLAAQEQKLTQTQQDLDQKSYELFQTEVELKDKQVKVHLAKRELQAAEEKMDALIGRIEDTERFVDEVAEVAYGKAVEAVTDKVREEVRNEDFEIIASERNAILHGYTFAPDTVRVIEGVFSGIMDRFKGMTSHITEKITAIFRSPEKKAQIKAPIKKSILDRLAKAQVDADAYNAARRAGRTEQRKNRDRYER
ncbi:MAG: serine/arginine repetitive matrix protein 2 [Blautia sp.]|nr:serine/arginine repetitive matrix protein 2 [Blautia sp.]